MNPIKCEMCGSNDVIKKDGYYVCEACGTKYTVEEARKLLVEGTVKIDNSNRANNLLELARRAKQSNDVDGAAKYYSQVVEIEPNNWEAYFYSIYYRAFGCKIYEISSALDIVTNALAQTFYLIQEHVKDPTEQQKAYKGIGVDCCTISEVFRRTTEDTYKQFPTATGASKERDERLNACVTLVMAVSLAVDTVFKDYAFANELRKVIIRDYGYHYNRQFLNNVVVSKIRVHEPDYNPFNSGIGNTGTNTNGGGCYIATCVYGSYDCPEVWTLRRFRDNILAEHMGGRLFIKIYYATSPTLVRLFGNQKWFQRFWRKCLNRIIVELRKEGVESSPYSDREW